MTENLTCFSRPGVASVPTPSIGTVHLLLLRLFGLLDLMVLRLSVDELIVLYKRRVIFLQYISKKHKTFGIKMYKLRDSLCYTYDTRRYLGKQRQHAESQITATPGTILQAIRRAEELGKKLLCIIISPQLPSLTVFSKAKSMRNSSP